MQSSPPADPSRRPSAGSAALPNLVAASWLALPWALQAAGSSFPQQAALLWMAGSVGLFLVAPAVAGWMGGRGPLLWALVPTELAFLGGLAALRLAAASPTCQVEALACEWLGIPATLLVWVSVAYPPTAAVSWALVRGARMGLRRAALAL